MKILSYFCNGSVFLIVFLLLIGNNNAFANPDPPYNFNRITVNSGDCVDNNTCTNAIIASGCGICASSAESTNPISYAFDADPSTFWRSKTLTTTTDCNANASADIVIDLGSPKWVEAIQLYYWLPQCGCSTEYTKTRIYASNDQTNWGYPIAFFSYEPYLETRTYSNSNTNPIQVRYLRISMDACPTAYTSATLHDVKVFGISGDCTDEYPDNYSSTKYQNPDNLLLEDPTPSPYAYSNMIGINAGPEWDCFYSPNSWCGANPFKGMLSHVRSFHLMEKDYQNHNSAWEPGCSSCPGNTSQCTPAGRGPLGPLRIGLNGGVGLYKLRYQTWNNDGFKDVQASLEAIHLYCEDSARQFPMKWWDEEEWGGMGNVYQNAKAYGRTFAEEFCPNNWECLIQHLEVGNEPWQYQDPCFYQQLLKGVIDGVKEHYQTQGITNPDDWPMKILPGAFQAFRDDIVVQDFALCNKWEFCPNRYDFIGDRIPKSYLPYLAGVSVHPYAFGTDNKLDVYPEAPASQSELPRFKSMVKWMNDNMPGKKVFVSEVGWDSYTVGQIAQGVYMLRSVLLMGRHHVFRTSMYTSRDQVGNPGDENCFANGLYNTSGLLTDWTPPENQECAPAPNTPKVIYHVVKETMSLLNNKRFFDVLAEDNNAYAYLIGDSGVEKATHIVAWKPTPLNTSDNYNDTNMYDLSTPVSIHLPEGYSLSGEPTQWIDGVWGNLYEESIPNSINGISLKLSGCPILIPVIYDPNNSGPTISPLCNDGIQNGDEMGVDCGSAICNHALGQYAVQTCIQDNGFANKAVDGNTNGQFYEAFSVAQTCWSNEPWWQVDIGGNKGIGSINIWNRTDSNMEYLSDYWVILSSQPIPDLPVTEIVNLPYVTSYYQSSQASTPTNIPVEISARYVRIQKSLPGFLSLAEVQVLESCIIADCVPAGTACDDGDQFTENDTWDGDCNCAGSIIDCENSLALNTTATQSSTFESGFAQSAIDGNTNGEYYEDFSVSQTLWEENPWWEVDMGSIKRVGRVNVYNRTDGNTEHLKDYHILVSDVPFNNTNLWNTIWQPGVSDYFVQEIAGTPTTTTVNRTGRYIRIQLQNTALLSIAEVEVIRDCSDIIICEDAGTVCDDFDATTINDVEDGFCNCSGTCVALGTACDDGNPYTENDVWDGNCNCAGINPCVAAGTPCDDNNPLTDNDIWDGFCNCAGGCIAAGTPCNDNDIYTSGDVWDGACNCAGTPYTCQQNVAVNKPSYQSCVAGGGEASRANDGNTDGNFNNGSVSQTCWKKTPYWEVDLGGSYNLETINIFNRTDADASYLNNLHVFVSDAPFVSENLADVEAQFGVSDFYFPTQIWFSESFTIDRTGRYIRVQLNENGILMMAEVQAIACVLQPLVGGGTEFVANNEVRETNNENTSTSLDIVKTELDAHLFPNPAQDLLHIQLKETAEAEVRIVVFNSIGQQVLQQQINLENGLFQLNTTKLQNGTYYTNIVVNETEVINKKFVIQK